MFSENEKEFQAVHRFRGVLGLRLALRINESSLKISSPFKLVFDS